MELSGGFFCSELGVKYFLLDDTLLLNFFDHSTNRTRFFFVGANKQYFAVSPFTCFPRGHITSEDGVPGMVRCLEDCATVEGKYYRSVTLDPPPSSLLPTSGYLVRLANVRQSKGKGSPQYPNHINDHNGVASTQLASHFRTYGSDQCFGVNTGLYLRFPLHVSYNVLP